MRRPGPRARPRRTPARSQPPLRTWSRGGALGRWTAVVLGLFVAGSTSCGTPGTSVPTLTAEAAQRLPRLLEAALRQDDATAPRDALWERLSASLADEALTERYLARTVSEQRARADEAEVLVDSVECEEIMPTGPFAADVTLVAGGRILHAGHRHPRSRRIRARVELGETAGGLRIVSLRPVRQESFVDPLVDVTFDLFAPGGRP